MSCTQQIFRRSWRKFFVSPQVLLQNAATSVATERYGKLITAQHAQLQMHGARAQLRASFRPPVGLPTTRVASPSRSLSATSCAPAGAGQSTPQQQQAATTAAGAGGKPLAPPTSASTTSSDPGEPSNDTAQAFNWVATQSALAAPVVTVLAAVVGVAACVIGGVRKLDEITSGLKRVEKAQSDLQATQSDFQKEVKGEFKEVKGEFSQTKNIMLAMAVMMWFKK